MRRRDLLGVGGAALAGAAAYGLSCGATQGVSARAPRLYDVTAFGATAKGASLDTASINAAIDACTAGGGGVVYFPPGVYLSGTVVVKSNVTLYFEANATLLGSKNFSDFSKDHLIYAEGAENIGIAGPGLIDGQGPAFWVPNGRKRPPAENDWAEVATWDWKPLPRPLPLIEIIKCKNVRIDDVRIENAPGWTIRPTNCDNVHIRGIAIKNPVIGVNTDGIDPTGCHNVFISDCLIDTGDDAICLKSEKDTGRATKNVTITNCVLTCCCNGLKFGTATHGRFENITFTNSVIFNDDVELRRRVISGIAVEMVDGGSLEGVVISNVRMQNVRTPIFIRRGNRIPRPDGTPGTLRGVMIENVHATGSVLTSSVTGLPGFDVEDVTLSNIRIDTDEVGKPEWVTRPIPEEPRRYPEAHMFGKLPSYGLYCRHVNGLSLRGIDFRGTTAETRPALVCDDVKNLDVDGLRMSAIEGDQPLVKLMQTRNAFLRGCVAPARSKTFLFAAGEETERIAVTASDIGSAQEAIRVDAAVRPGAVLLDGKIVGT